MYEGIFKHDEAESYNLDFSNFLIRGTTLKNTKFIFGLVVYTGHETKVMMNIVRSSSKKSALEKKMEAQILIIFLIQVFNYKINLYNYWKEFKLNIIN